MANELVSVNDAARMLATTPEDVRQMVEKDTLPSQSQDGKTMIPRAAVVQLMVVQESPASPDFDQTGIVPD